VLINCCCVDFLLRSPLGIYAEWTELVEECIVPQTYRSTIAPLEMVYLLNEKEIGKKLLDLSEKTPI